MLLLPCVNFFPHKIWACIVLVCIHNCSHYNWLISLWFIAVCESVRRAEDENMKFMRNQHVEWELNGVVTCACVSVICSWFISPELYTRTPVSQIQSTSGDADEHSISLVSIHVCVYSTCQHQQSNNISMCACVSVCYSFQLASSEVFFIPKTIK